MCVFADSDDSSRHLKSVLINSSKESSMRASISKWNSKSLCVSKCDINSLFSWRFYQSTSQQISDHDDQRFVTLDFFNFICPILNSSFKIWILQYHSADVCSVFKACSINISNFNFYSKRLCSSFDNSQTLWENFVRNKDHFSFFSKHTEAHSHSFSSSSCFTE